MDVVLLPREPMNPGYHVSDLVYFGAACLNVEKMASRAMYQLEPGLRKRVQRLCDRMGGRVSPWTGFRNEEEQNAAWLRKRSNARWLQSPHNYQPALACDLVLNPQRVNVRENPRAPGWPDLWDNETHEAQQAWIDLHARAVSLGLGRVRIRIGGAATKAWDRPHVQLKNWKELAGLTDGD
jgi:hypothetical protein